MNHQLKNYFGKSKACLYFKSLFAIKAILCFACLCLFASNSHAGLITVNAQIGESGCNLRDAILSANTNAAVGGCNAGTPDSAGEDLIIVALDLIRFGGDDEAIPSEQYGPSFLPHISSKISIFGFPNTVTLERAFQAPKSRFFTVTNGGELSLTNMRLVKGGKYRVVLNIETQKGGAIYVTCGSSARLNLMELKENRAHFGGAIAVGDSNCNQATRLTVSQSLFHKNVVFSQRAEFKFAGGAVAAYPRSLVNISDTTISDNFASYGGGIACPDASVNTLGCSLNLINTTITGNRGSWGGGIYIGGSREGGGRNSLIIRNSIVSGNQGGKPYGYDVTVVIPENQQMTSLVNNVFGNSEQTTKVQSVGSLSSASLTNNILAMTGDNETPLNQIISPLQDNGGQFMSHELTPNSPALNKGIEAEYGGAPLFQIRGRGCRDVRVFPMGLLDFRDDQNGTKRPIGNACDIGAVESRYGEDEMCYAIPTKNAKTVVFCL